MKKTPFFAAYIEERWDINPLRDAKTFNYLIDASEISDQIISKYGLTASDRKALTAALVFAFLAGGSLSDGMHKELSDCEKALAGVRTQSARRVKDQYTHAINRVIANCAAKHWRKRPAHRNNLRATANSITEAVTRGLKGDGIPVISNEAIRQRLIKLTRS
jgi:hypothetical protein